MAHVPVTVRVSGQRQFAAHEPPEDYVGDGGDHRAALDAQPRSCRSGTLTLFQDGRGATHKPAASIDCKDDITEVHESRCECQTATHDM
jgi:hypothetical protein